MFFFKKKDSFGLVIFTEQFPVWYNKSCTLNSFPGISPPLISFFFFPERRFNKTFFLCQENDFLKKKISPGFREVFQCYLARITIYVFVQAKFVIWVGIEETEGEREKGRKD